ncbi:hypothetical protein [Bacillus sp. FJAT-45350]|uniref:hypothetical protein n=1 Tax=Bacillus sp. FJAT-45350 TaxID=2011014 RepID=UPI000BB83966|nr:hypothetical protein [Bacillus sp. FJAT-45350]
MLNPHMCPLCNGMEPVRISCTNCSTALEDKGRIIDYFDDYSAYLDIDDMKKIDGIQNDYSEHQCPHILYCPNCHSESTLLVKEITYKDQ